MDPPLLEGGKGRENGVFDTKQYLKTFCVP